MTTIKEPTPPALSWRTLFRETVCFIRETPPAWLFGLVLSLPACLAIILESLSSELEEADLLLMAPRIIGLLLLGAFLFLVSEAGLILSFKKNPYSPIEHVAATGALIRWYFLFLLILLASFAFFFSPFLIAPTEAQFSLKYISLVFFLFIASVAFILKMFGSFYLLLSRLSLGSAFRSAATLFMDHASPSTLLFIATCALSVLTGISFSMLHALLSFPLSHSILLNGMLLFCLLLLSAFFNIFLRAFWYFFFQALAGKRPNDWQKEEKMVEESMLPVQDEA